jgi:hypothetical protein
MNVHDALILRSALIPTSGYTVVGIDTFGSPDEQGPYVVGNFATKVQAEEVARRMTKRSGERFYIYESCGRSDS